MARLTGRRVQPPVSRPWQNYQEMLVDRALMAAISDPETIREIRPAHPQILFPETRGMVKQSMDLETVMNLDRYMATNRSWVSGMPVMRTKFTDDTYMGSGRYSMGALWS
jgi:hypothetical protein